MKMLRNILSAFLRIVALTALVHAQSPSGFISIDCGLPENSGYIDNKTGLNYTSDANFIDTGERNNISSEYKTATIEQQFLNVRSFPEGRRNCYTLKLNATSGDAKFLVRVRFMYGNYDGKDIVPSFSLMLEADKWDSVELKDPSTIVTKEIIHIPKKEYIYVCLVNTGSGTPFISAIELRPLPNSTYHTQSGSLSLFRRWDAGTTTNETYRYKDDVFDRIWSPFSSVDWAPISTTQSINSSDLNEYKPPSAIMTTAVIPSDPTNSVGYYWWPSDASYKYYIYLHFAEVELKGINKTREMNIYINGIQSYGPFDPEYLATKTVYIIDPISARKNEFAINTTQGSTLPPILNAFEIYRVKEFLQLLTNQQDVDAIMNIKSKYGVKRDWQGDPCAPKVYSWEGLNCTYDAYEPPRIISLNLSSSGIAGEIVPYMFCLTSVESLDLSNNSLTGPVPEFLTELRFLRVLNLTGNNLEGSVPAGLIQKAKNGLLSLRFTFTLKHCL